MKSKKAKLPSLFRPSLLADQVLNTFQILHNTYGRGEVQDTRLEAKIKNTKIQDLGYTFQGQILSRPRTGLLEAKAKDQSWAPAPAAAIWQKKQRRCRLSLLK